MSNPKRDILVVVKNQFISEEAIEQEVICLNNILCFTESDDQFCKAHELVDRNTITRKKVKIFKESRHHTLRPFRFLINRN